MQQSPSSTNLALEQVLQPIATARGLPNTAYNSAEWAALECNHILADSWFCLGFEHDLAPGHARAITALQRPLLMVKDKSGKTRVFHNVCRHRGHLLVERSCNLKGSIRCPYHSWRYDFEGRLIGTPDIGGPGVHSSAGFDNRQFGLIEIRSSVWLGMVFINLSGRAQTFERRIEPLTERWQPLVGRDGLAELRAVSDGVAELSLNANWKLAVENYCESYHLPTVHPSLTRGSPLEDHYPIADDAVDGAGQGCTNFDFTEQAGAELPRFSRWPDDKAGIAEYLALYPNVLLGIQRDHFYAIVLTPNTVDSTIERLQIYVVGNDAASDIYASDRQTLLRQWLSVFEEDLEPVESMQTGRNSRAFDGGVFSPVMDEPTHHFHRWIAARALQALDNRDLRQTADLQLIEERA